MGEIKPDHTLDARGDICPIPALKTKKELEKMAVDEVLEVLTSDRASQKDIPALAKRSGVKLLKMTEEAGTFKFYLKK